MTSSTGRLYAFACAIATFFLLWALVATHPFGAAGGADRRLAVLAAREARLRHEAAIVRRVVALRWSTYRARLKLRRAEIAARAASVAPAPVAPVRIVNLPPLTITRTS